MDNRWQQAFAELTGGAGVKQTALKSFCLALLATALTIPYFHHLLVNVSGGERPGAALVSDILYGQIVLFFVVCMLSLLVGYGFMWRYALPGFGRISQWRRDIPYLVAIGFLLMLIYCIVFGRNFDNASAAAYPVNLLYLIVFPLNSMLSDELILRFGLVTIAVGLCRNKTAGIALSALFAAMITEKYVGFAGLDPDASFLGIRFAFAFGIHFLLGFMFVTRGLFHSMTVRVILEFRYPAAVLLFG